MTFETGRRKKGSKRFKTRTKREKREDKLSPYSLWFLENHVKERLRALGVLQ